MLKLMDAWPGRKNYLLSGVGMSDKLTFTLVLSEGGQEQEISTISDFCSEFDLVTAKTLRLRCGVFTASPDLRRPFQQVIHFTNFTFADGQFIFSTPRIVPLRIPRMANLKFSIVTPGKRISYLYFLAFTIFVCSS